MFSDRYKIIQMENEFHKHFRELTELPTVNKADKAISHKQTLLYFNVHIPEVLSVLTPDDQFAFLMASKDVIDADKLATAVAHLTKLEHRHEFIADQENKITPHNLVAIVLALFPEPDKRLTYIKTRLAKVTKKNLHIIALILADKDREKFIEELTNKLSKTNIALLLDFIAEKKRVEFMQTHAKLLTRDNLIIIIEKIAPEFRAWLIDLSSKNIKSTEMAALCAFLPEDQRLTFTITYTALIGADNLVAVMGTLSPEERTVTLVQKKEYISAQNFVALTALLPEDLQLEFFDKNIQFLHGQRAGIWIESISKLARKEDRYSVVEKHQNTLISEKDVFTLVWAMEILSTQGALKLAKANLKIVKTADDAIALISCKALDFADKLALIVFYKPVMLKQKDKDQQTFRVRKYFAEQLAEITGKSYPRGDNTDLQGLDILVTIAKRHLAIKSSQHDPRIFGAPASSDTQQIVTAEASTEKRFTA
jgi:RNase P/RNase MRP subunit POP5